MKRHVNLRFLRWGVLCMRYFDQFYLEIYVSNSSEAKVEDVSSPGGLWPLQVKNWRWRSTYVLELWKNMMWWFEMERNVSSCMIIWLGWIYSVRIALQRWEVFGSDVDQSKLSYWRDSTSRFCQVQGGLKLRLYTVIICYDGSCNLICEGLLEMVRWICSFYMLLETVSKTSCSGVDSWVRIWTTIYSEFTILQDPVQLHPVYVPVSQFGTFSHIQSVSTFLQRVSGTCEWTKIDG